MERMLRFVSLAVLGATLAGGAARADGGWNLLAHTSWTPAGPVLRREGVHGASSTERFTSARRLGLAATRGLSPGLGLAIEADYRGMHQGRGIVGVPELPLTTGSLRAEYLSFGVGLELAPWAAGKARPYLRLTPALFASRWEESTVDHAGWDFMAGEYRERSSHRDVFRDVLPGWSATLGLQTRLGERLGLDTAVRVTRSADHGEHELGRFSRGDLLGLEETAVVAGLNWMP